MRHTACPDPAGDETACPAKAGDKTDLIEISKGHPYISIKNPNG